MATLSGHTSWNHLIYSSVSDGRYCSVYSFLRYCITCLWYGPQKWRIASSYRWMPQKYLSYESARIFPNEAACQYVQRQWSHCLPACCNFWPLCRRRRRRTVDEKNNSKTKKISRLKFLRLNWTNLMVIIIWPSNINSICLSQFYWGI